MLLRTVSNKANGGYSWDCLAQLCCCCPAYPILTLLISCCCFYCTSICPYYYTDWCWLMHIECANYAMDAQKSWSVHIDSEGEETRTEMPDIEPNTSGCSGSNTNTNTNSTKQGHRGTRTTGTVRTGSRRRSWWNSIQCTSSSEELFQSLQVKSEGSSSLPKRR